MKRQGHGLDAKRTKLTLSRFDTLKKDGEVFSPNKVKFLLNYSILPDGTLKKRPPLKKLVSITNPHSIFKINDTTFLVCSSVNGFDKLYRYDLRTSSLFFITDLSISYNKLWYVQIENNIYMSNKFWKGILNTKTNTVTEWVPPQSAPIELSTEASDYIFTDAIEFPNCENLCFFGGRIFGSVDNKLHYTEPIFFTYTKPYNFVEFDAPITSISATDTLLFIGLTNKSCVCSIADASTFTLKIDTYPVACLPYSSQTYNNTFIFLTQEGICLFRDNTYKIINKGFVNMEITHLDSAGAVSDGLFLFNTDKNNIDFKDDIIIDIIKPQGG